MTGLPTFRRICRPALVALLLSASLPVAGCGESAPRQSYPLEGRVVSVDAERGRLTVDHGDVPGYMPPMTMPFRVKDDWVFQAATPGCRISANLIVEGKATWLENVVVTPVPGPAGAPSMIDGATEPVPGEAAPPFSLTTHRYKPISLQSLKGSAVLVTFIFSRCPLPDYCPLMTERFAEIDRLLLGDPRFASRVRLVSITIDPEFDTPGVLNAHASEVATIDGKVPENWDFATSDPATIRKVAEAYGLVYGKEDGQIVHSLRTAIVGPDGTLVKVYRGNEWKVATVVEDLRSTLK